MLKKKLYEAPTVRKVSLDVQAAVLGTCAVSPQFIVNPCVIGSNCPDAPTGITSPQFRN